MIDIWSCIINLVLNTTILFHQADDTLLTEQRNLLDLINKLEGGLGQVKNIFAPHHYPRYIIL